MSGDTLDLNGTNSFTSATDNSVITASYANGLLTLTTASGTANAADYQAALELVHFSHTGDPTSGGTDNSRTLTWTVVDTNSIATENTSLPVTSTINVVHTPPSVTGVNGTTVTYAEQQTGTTFLDSGLTVSDSDALTSATVTVSGFQSGDVLSVGNLDGLTLTTNANGTIVLSGSGTSLQYQTALDSISFSETVGTDPTHGGAATEAVRNVSWTLVDANSANNTSSFSSTLDTVHKAPVVTAGANVTFTEGSTGVTADGTLTVTNSDSIKSATVSITGGFLSGDKLDLNGTNSFTASDNAVITASYNAASGLLTLTTASGTATAADYQAALDLVHFSHTGDPTNGGADPTRTLTWTVVDTNSIATENTSSTGDEHDQRRAHAAERDRGERDDRYLCGAADGDDLPGQRAHGERRRRSDERDGDGLGLPERRRFERREPRRPDADDERQRHDRAERLGHEPAISDGAWIRSASARRLAPTRRMAGPRPKRCAA